MITCCMITCCLCIFMVNFRAKNATGCSAVSAPMAQVWPRGRCLGLDPSAQTFWGRPLGELPEFDFVYVCIVFCSYFMPKTVHGSCWLFCRFIICKGFKNPQDPPYFSMGYTSYLWVTEPSVSINSHYSTFDAPLINPQPTNAIEAVFMDCQPIMQSKGILRPT